MKYDLKCENCCYFWKEDRDERAMCHWESRCPGDFPPCEEDYEEEEADDYE